MVDDFSVLVAELERCFGEERVLPSRNELREMNRCAWGRLETWLAGWLVGHGGSQTAGLSIQSIAPACQALPCPTEQSLKPHSSTPTPPTPPRRSDLEKAISAHGGPSQVAAQLGWKQRAKGRRPKGYWDSLDNVRAELDEFIEEAGLPPGVSLGHLT